MMKITTLTTAEEQLMKVLWNLNSAYMRNIIEAYPEPKPHANTISTFLKILVEKEFLTTTKEGRIFNYHVAIPYFDYRNFLVENFINDYFDGSVSDLRNFIDQKQDSSFDQVVKVKEKEKKSNLEDSDFTDFIDELITSKKKKKKKKKNKLKSMDEVKINVKKKK